MISLCLLMLTNVFHNDITGNQLSHTMSYWTLDVYSSNVLHRCRQENAIWFSTARYFYIVLRAIIEWKRSRAFVKVVWLLLRCRYIISPLRHCTQWFMGLITRNTPLSTGNILSNKSNWRCFCVKRQMTMATHNGGIQNDVRRAMKLGNVIYL